MAIAVGVWTVCGPSLEDLGQAGVDVHDVPLGVNVNVNRLPLLERHRARSHERIQRLNKTAIICLEPLLELLNFTAGWVGCHLGNARLKTVVWFPGNPGTPKSNCHP